MTRLVLVGGGLANGLIALKLLRERPEVDVTVLEAGPALGGNHTWSFHERDLTPAQHDFVRPLVSASWAGQEVRFPNHRRTLSAGYFSIASDQLRDVLMRELGGRVRLNAPVEALRPDGVMLGDGERIGADAVIDGRGFRPSPAMTIRFQTFLGRELRFAAPHGLVSPVIMDATTPQEGGYRFTYVLPLSADTALVEDTAYEDAGRIDRAALSRRIDRYCEAQGWRPVETLREEAGVLPITLNGDPQRFRQEQGAVPAVGLRGNFFHPVTGYSLPDAVRVAELLAALPELGSAATRAALQDHSERLWRERRFFRALNRMLFLAGKPDERWRVMERFYRLPEKLISRFYAARLTPRDKLRILVGKPPVPILDAVKALAWRGGKASQTAEAL